MKNENVGQWWENVGHHVKTVYRTVWIALQLLYLYETKRNDIWEEELWIDLIFIFLSWQSIKEVVKTVGSGDDPVG